MAFRSKFLQEKYGWQDKKRNKQINETFASDFMRDLAKDSYTPEPLQFWDEPDPVGTPRPFSAIHKAPSGSRAWVPDMIDYPTIRDYASPTQNISRDIFASHHKETSKGLLQQQLEQIDRELDDAIKAGVRADKPEDPKDTSYWEHLTELLKGGYGANPERVNKEALDHIRELQATKGGIEAEMEKMRVKDWEDQQREAILAAGGQDLLDEVMEYAKMRRSAEPHRIMGGGGYVDINKYRELEDSLRSRFPDQIEDWNAYADRINTSAEFDEKVNARKQFAADHPILAGIASPLTIPENAISGVGYVDAYQQGIYNKVHGIDAPINYKTPAMVPSASVEAHRGQVAENIEKGTEGWVGSDTYLGNLYGNAYQLAMSMGDSAAVLPFSAVGAPGAMLPFFGSAATSSMRAAKDRGATDMEAFTVGTIAGAAEVLTEKYSIENLLNMDLDRGIIKNLLIQSGVEASEEGASTIINTIADHLVMGNKSEYQNNIRAHMAEGMDYEAAKSASDNDWWSGFLNDVIGGALSGGLMAGIGQGVSKTGQAIQNRIMDQYAQSLDPMAELQRAAAQMYNVPDNDVGKKTDASGKDMNVPASDGLASERKATAEENPVVRTEENKGGTARSEQPQSGKPRTGTDILENYSKSFGQAGKDALRDFYTEGQDMPSYYAGFSAFYEAGLSGDKITNVRTPFYNQMTNAQQVAAYAAGRADAQASLQSEQQASKSVRVTKGKLIRNEFAKGLKDEEIRQLDRLASATGSNIEIVPHLVNDANGLYNKRTGSILISADANSPVVTVAAHEVTHRMQALSPKEYRSFRNYAINHFRSTHGDFHVPDLIRRYAEDGVKLTHEEAMDEVAAEFVEAMVKDEALFEEFARKDKKSAKTVLETIKQFIRDVKDKLRGKQRDRVTKEKYGMDLESLEEAVAKWNDALKAATGAVEARQGKPAATVSNKEKVQGNGVQFSLKRTDSDGRELTDAQMEYFKDSKAVDTDGNLLVLYHQTGNDFTVFDTRHEGAGSRDEQTPFGIFMKTSPDSIGLKGAKQMELYANLTNPLNASSREDLTRKLRKISNDYAKMEREYQELNDDYQQKYDEADKKPDEFIKKWRKENPTAGRRALWDVPEFVELYDAPEAILTEWEAEASKTETKMKDALTETLKKEGYDGVILETDAGSFGRKTDAYIALEASQVKSVDNKNPTSDPDIRFSFAGERAKGADHFELERAKQKEKEGYSAKDILLQTGWFRGADRKWRYEIDDSGMTYNRQGDNQARDNYPEYNRYKSLLDRAEKHMLGLSTEDLTDNEKAELKELGRTWGVDAEFEIPEDITIRETVADYIRHDELFHAYPWIKNVGLQFVDFKDDQTRGLFDSSRDVIYLSNDLKGRPEKTILHEIQHAIQHNEQFASGSSPEHWFRETYGTRRGLKDARERLQKWLDKIGYSEAVKASAMEVAAKKKTMDQHWKDMEEFKKNSPHARQIAYIENDIKYLENKLDKMTKGKSSFEQYWNTAGEIEARDTEARKDLTKEERRRKTPNIGEGDDVFFVEPDLPVRYSVKNRMDTADARKAEALQRENDSLRQKIEYWKGQTKTSTAPKTKPDAVAKAARDLRKQIGTDADVTADLQTLYDGIASGKLTGEEAYAQAADIAMELVENAVDRDDSMYQDYAELRKKMRDTRILISETDAENFPDFKDFKKSQRGHMRIAKGDTTNVDTVYKELAELYPEFFDETETTHPADQLQQIADVLDSIYEIKEYNPYDRYMDQAITGTANEILETFFDIPEVHTYADRMQDKMTRQQLKADARLAAEKEKNRATVRDIRTADDMYYGRKMAEQQRKAGDRLEAQRQKTRDTQVADEMFYGRKLQELRNQNRKATADAIAKEKNRRTEDINRLKETYRAKDAVGRDRRNAKEMRAKIIRHVGKLKEKLLRPSDKQHVPEELISTVATLLEAINLESGYSMELGQDGKYHRVAADDPHGTPTKRTEAFQALQKQYSDIVRGDRPYNLVVDPNLVDNLTEVIAMSDVRLDQMDLKQLGIVWETLKGIEASILSANKAFRKAAFETIEEIATGIRLDNWGKGNRRNFNNKAANAADKLASVDMMTPEAFFHRLGKTAQAVFQVLRDAQDKQIRITEEAQTYTEEILGKTDITELEEDLKTFQTEAGEEITLSVAQIMTIRELLKREAALDHIMVGGIRPTSLKKKGIWKQQVADPVRVTIKDLENIVGSLTNEQIKLADGLQAFLGGRMSELGNEASLEVYGYRKFNDPNYWPIKVDNNQTKTDIPKEAQAATIAGRGFTKATKPHASNAVRIGSAFDVYAQHVTDMATYNAWLAAMEDLRRVLDFSFWESTEDGMRQIGNTKATIERIFGENGSGYLRKLMDDINQGVAVDAVGGPTAGLTAKFKAAAIGANARVVLQQPTAIMRAAAVLHPKYLAQARPSMKKWALVKKYCPIAVWKDWGYFDISTGRSMKNVLFGDDTRMQKVIEKLMAPAGMADSVTWSAIWSACEAEARDRTDLEPGSDAFYQHVAKRFNEVIDKTQVVDGILQRSQIMRSGDGLNKMASSFMAEPTKTYNMFVNAAYDLKHATGKQKKAMQKQMGRVTGALVASFAANAVMQSLMDALRDDDREKEYWEKFGENWLENFGANFNPLSYVPYAKDVLSIIQGYDVTRTDMDVVAKSVNAGRELVKALSGDGKRTVTSAMVSFLADASRLLGLPVANIKRDAMAILNTYANESGNLMLQYRIDKAMLRMSNPANKKRFYDYLYKAMQTDQDAYHIMIKDLARSGFKVEEITSAMEKRMKEAQGVKSTDELDQRFLMPEQQAYYDKAHKSAQTSTVWKKAGEEQRDYIEDALYDLAAGTKTGQKITEKAEAAGVTDTDFILYQAALRIVDAKGNDNGSYDQEETEAALKMTGMSRSDRAALWDLRGWKADNPFK